jgi:sugar (pentulose or hexulose) kinase
VARISVYHLPLKKEWLPKVVPSGDSDWYCFKRYSPKSWALPETVKITAGITDGCASQIASGAINPGDWNTTIGTTMVIKGVTKNEVLDPLGRLYSHRHPAGYWMPGGASNTGADWVTNEFGDDLVNLNEQAGKAYPYSLLRLSTTAGRRAFSYLSTAGPWF